MGWCHFKDGLRVYVPGDDMPQEDVSYTDRSGKQRTIKAGDGAGWSRCDDKPSDAVAGTIVPKADPPTGSKVEVIPPKEGT